MFSKILIKLVDQSVVPAVLLLSARVVSVVLLSKYFNVVFSIGSSGFEYQDPADYVLVNSYSTLVMILMLALGIFYVLLKSLAFHETHISPKITARLFSLKLSSLVQDSFTVYSQGTIWLSYLYLLLMVSGIMALFSLLYAWVFYVALGLSVVSTALLIFDVENELMLAKEDGQDPSSEDFVLNYGDSYE